MDNFYSLIINNRTLETTDSVSITFDIPSDIEDKFSFIPGQYITVKAIINQQEVRRSYSISSAPYEKKVTIAVKKIDGGKMSTYLFDEINEGDTLDIHVPEGKFLAKVNPELCRDHYFIAAGSGITPVISMIKTILEEEPKSTCYLYYGNRTENSIIYHDQLTELSRKYSGQLSILHTISQPLKVKSSGLKGIFGIKKTVWTGETGRIDIPKFINFLELHPARTAFQEFYICGPGAMIQSIEKIILDRDIPEKNIHREYFTTIKQESKEMKGLQDATLHAKQDEKEITIPLPKDKTILDALIEANFNPPYSCTSGACSSCIAKIKEGSIEMEVDFALDKDEIKAGYILTCQARPTSKNISIFYDEVDLLK